MLQKLLRRAKLIVMAPPEIEALRYEVTRASREADTAHEVYRRSLDRAVTVVDDNQARRFLEKAQTKQRLAQFVLSEAIETYLRTGTVSAESLKSQLSNYANKASSKKPRR